MHLPAALDDWLAAHTGWIRSNTTWSRLKPVIRCAVVGWVGLVLFVIPRVEITLGNASFLILVASFLSPPSDPFLSVLERELLILLFVAIAWAWSCLGIFFANLARRFHDPTATLLDAVTGQYIEASPTVIIAVFIFLGSAFFLYLKARLGPGPYLFACVFACIAIDISLTTAVLFPFPFYTVGRTIILPLALHTALSLAGSVLIFPSTISAQFTSRLQDITAILAKALKAHDELLQMNPSSPDFLVKSDALSATAKQCEGALVPLAASARLLTSDLIYCRFAPADFVPFQQMSRRFVGRLDGLGTYFALIDPRKDRLPFSRTESATPSKAHTPAPSIPTTPGHMTPINSRGRSQSPVPRSPSRTRSGSRTRSLDKRTGPRASSLASERRSHHHHRHPHTHYAHHHSRDLHRSLLSLARSRARRVENAVGTFESQRYLNLETSKLHDPNAEHYIDVQTAQLQQSSHSLLGACTKSLDNITEWLGTVRSGRIKWWIKPRTESKRVIEERIDKFQSLRDELSKALDIFRKETRHFVLDQYAPAFSPTTPSQGEEGKEGDEDTDSGHEIPPHRYLFHCYVYQFHLTRMTATILDWLDHLIDLEQHRSHPRLWTPFQVLLKWDQRSVSEQIEQIDDDDPNVIQGLRNAAESTSTIDLGLATRRDPDALPPRNRLERVALMIYLYLISLGGGNILFSLKAGALTTALCMPFFFKNLAEFAYENRGSWAVFMGQLTLARFRGDTIFGLTARIGSTFFGGVTGMVMWCVYLLWIRAWHAFGLAAVCAVCFPFFFFGRIYLPVHPMTNIIFFVTGALVIGYSYQDLHLPAPGSPGFGFSVAWRRFILVAIGVTAAFICSLLPPSSTIRRYHRSLLATTAAELGAIYCSVLSFANDNASGAPKDVLSAHITDITTDVVAVRAKLNKSLAMSANAGYEISLRGHWPRERYRRIVDLQVSIAFGLSHLLAVLENLDLNWTLAFLRRTRFMDPDFQGDILAVISMVSSALRNGTPLPQITPCPLIDRFLLKYHGLDVIHKDAAEDYGLPRVLTLDTLRNEQYLMFCVGISTAFGLINRLDRLMVATKEIVGEQYHIHGMGAWTTMGAALALRRTTTAGTTHTNSLGRLAGDVYHAEMDERIGRSKTRGNNTVRFGPTEKNV